MTPRPAPQDLLRHRPPALCLDALATAAAGTLVCTARARAWTWATLLEGAAQTAGLLVGMQPGGLGDDAVVAEYRDVRATRETWDGDVRFTARMDRRVQRFWRCVVEATAPDGAPLLSARVTLAPPGADA